MPSEESSKEPDLELAQEMKVTFDAEEMASFFQGFVPLEALPPDALEHAGLEFIS